MKIAIIGGGASGMITAYLLNKKHQITVFEKQAMLGGNIRTINKNVSGVDLDSRINLDNGVIEFEANNFIHFHRLMDELKVNLAPVAATTNLFLADGRFYLAPFGIQKNFHSRWSRYRQYLKSLSVGLNWWQFYRRSRSLRINDLLDRPVGEFYRDSTCFKWMRMLLMYCYSIPYQDIDEVPALLGIPITRDYGFNARWNRIKGGVYTYIEKILAQFDGKVLLSATIQSVHRTDDQVTIKLSDGQHLDFDKVVFATPPDQVLKLLADPSDEERKRFGPWKANRARTIIHTDSSMYRPFGINHFSEFDLFEKAGGTDAGYNAFLNKLAGLPGRHERAYHLSFNLEDRIDPASILHVQEHHTPLYTVAAMKYLPEIKALNGHRHTYHTGAYLGNGLHEGAVTAALAVAKLLGGKIL